MGKDGSRRPSAPLACIIMAAGRGTRMAARGLPKVCFPVVGVAAINRSIANYRSCGTGTIVVVVGADGQQVIDTVSSEFDGVLFTRQREPRGTGDAIKAGFEPLNRLGFDGLVFCAVGDKVVQPEAVKEVIERLVAADADGALGVTRKPQAGDMGRVVVNARGDAVAIVEEADLRAAEVAARIVRQCRRPGRAVDLQRVRGQCLEAMGSERACERYLGRAWTQISRGGRISAARLKSLLPQRPGSLRIGRRWMSASSVRNTAPFENESLYLFKAGTLARGLRLLKRRPHGEVYITDIVSELGRARDGRPSARIIPVLLRDPDWLIGFNTPDQLMYLEEKLRSRVAGAQRIRRPRVAVSRRLMRPAADWVRLIEAFPPRVRRRFAAVYGSAPAVLEERRRELLRSLKRFCRAFGGDRRVVVARAPATVNLMGRHVDVVGGYINVINVDREAVVIASPREDDLVRLVHAGGRGSARREFAIGREIASIGWEDWLTYISSDRVREMVSKARGDWSNIVRAAAVRLQQHFKTQRLRGMDAVVQSDIPLAAGLGASSAMLVAASEAMVALNGLKISPHQFVLLCGEGEWYLGSRGTAASHAGMKLGRRGCFAHLRFLPLEVGRLVPFPQEYRVVLVHAREAAAEAPGPETRARALKGMDIGLQMLRDRHPHVAHLVEHVRDLNPSRLGTSLAALYEMLMGVPRRATPAAVRRLLSADGRRRLEEIVGDLPWSRALPLRDVLLFGMAECARSAWLPRVLEREDLPRAAALFRASHNAERVVDTGKDGSPKGFRWAASDLRLRRCMEDLRSEDPERVLRAQLEFQAGRFSPGAAAIDEIVDIAGQVPGMVGAQLSGAGAGGCVMIVAHEGALDALKQALRRQFFRPRKLRARVDVCSFAEGAGLCEL